MEGWQLPNVTFRCGTQEKVYSTIHLQSIETHFLIQNFCYIHFRDHIEWNQISNNVKPGGNFVVLDLEPATWYNVRITAHNSAGFTVAEYEFATLTVTGGICFLFEIYLYIIAFEKCAAEKQIAV